MRKSEVGNVTLRGIFRPSSKQETMLRAGQGGYVNVRGLQRPYRRALGLHDLGYMDRHPRDSYQFCTNERGDALLAVLDGDGVDVSNMGRVV